MNKDNTKNIISEADDIKEIIKSQTSQLISEAVKDTMKKYMKESILSEDEDENEKLTTDEAEVSDSVDSNVDELELSNDESEISVDNETDVDVDVETLDDEPTLKDEADWKEFENFDVSGEGTYDMTEIEDTNTLAKVYKLLKDGDEVIVTKDANKIELKDSQTGAEYIIQTEGDEESTTSEIDELSIEEGADEFVGIEDEGGETLDLTQLAEFFSGDDSNETKETEDEEEVEETITESDESCAKGEDEEPIDEATSVTSKNARSKSKTHTSNTREKNLPKGSQTISTAEKGYVGSVNEKVLNKALLIKEENENLVKTIKEMRDLLNETLVTNTNLCHIIKLFTENITTPQDKQNIIKRFGENADTLKEGKQLYKTISNELSSTKVKTVRDVIKERQYVETKKNTSQLNEKVIHQSPEIERINELIRNMDKK